MVKKEELKYIETIKYIMNEKKLSQQKFGEMIGVNQTTVSQWLLGKKKPNYDNILAICIKFELSPNEFFGI